MIRLLAALMFLSMAVVLYPQSSTVRSQAGPYSTRATAETRYCAKPTEETEPPDCSFSNIKERLSRELKGKGWRALLQAIAQASLVGWPTEYLRAMRSSISW
jgi:hypothetical protein